MVHRLGSFVYELFSVWGSRYGYKGVQFVLDEPLICNSFMLPCNLSTTPTSLLSSSLIMVLTLIAAALPVVRCFALRQPESTSRCSVFLSHQQSSSTRSSGEDLQRLSILSGQGQSSYLPSRGIVHHGEHKEHVSDEFSTLDRFPSSSPPQLPGTDLKKILMELLIAATIVSAPFILFSVYYLLSKYVHSGGRCYLLSYQCYKPPDEQKMSTANSLQIALRNSNLVLEDYRFLQKEMVSSGIGDETYCPRNIMEGREASPSLQESLKEMDDIVFDTLDRLFAASGISPSQVDILITTASLFAPCPSISCRIVNRYKMKEGIKSYSLSGMGCSSSLVAVDLVRQQFKLQPNALAVVVSAETLGANFYRGRDRSMMLQNVTYRTGGASILLTNSPALKHRAMLELTALVRTHPSSDESYECAIEMEDEQGYRGFRVLLPKVARVARQCLVENFKVLLPSVLPVWEIIRFAVQLSTPLRLLRRRSRRKRINMKTGIDHFCLQPNTRALVDGFRTSLELEEDDMEPSRMTLHRFGFTSCSSLWYVLGYMEAKKRLRKGEKVLMVSMGAGYMCITCVWKVVRDDLGDSNVWGDCIHEYPQQASVNDFAFKFGWIQEDCVNFIRYDDYVRAQYSRY
ncbi:unnamed protein product [Linum trigynum]|uniref:very-long-chain 3-oxoacyl-CoA synthase n=2 Tax=Linum trigynum TaxID=586398 RepID=A0AAV2DM76_9ROSI